MPSSRPPDDSEDGPILGPEELDIERNENVVPIDEGRYVIASDVESAKRAEAIAAEAAERNAKTATESGAAGRADADGRGNVNRNDGGDATATGPHGIEAAEPRSGSRSADSRSGRATAGSRSEPATGEITPEALTGEHVRRWHERSLEGVDSHYGFRLSVKTGDRVAHQQLFSDDVATLFDGLLTWYAGQLDRETPVEDVLGILLAESNVRTRFPPRTIKRVLATHDLTLDDSIGELFGAAADGEGVVFPPDDAGEFVFPSGDESDRGD